MNSFREQMRGYPVWQMAVVSMVRVSEPIAFTSLFPYIYYMVRDFHITKDPSQISQYSMVLVASFAVSQFFCCIRCGRLSDRIGRKPIMIIGLCGSALSLLVFGFAKNFYVALVARVLAGAFNGYIAVIQTVVGEVVTQRKHHAFGFAMIPLFWNIGCVIGPLIGRSEYLTRPKLDQQDVFSLVSSSSHESFISHYPYALSNVAVSGFLLVSALFTFLFLDETHSGFTKRYDIGLVIGDSILHILGFNTPKRPWNNSSGSTETTPLTAESVTSYVTQENTPREDPPKDSPKEEQISFFAALGNREIFSHQVLLSVLAFFTIMFHTLVHVQFAPVFLAGTFERDQLSFPWHIKGGLNWPSEDINTLFSTVGFLGCFIVLVFYPIMDRYVRTIIGFRIASIMYPLAYFVVPYTIFMYPGYNPNFPSWVYKAFLYTSSMLEIVGSALGFPQVTILIYRSTKPKHRALVNSTAMAASACARFIAPLIWGSLTSFFEKKGMAQIPWNILALVGAFSVYLSFKIRDPSEEVESREEV